MSIVLIRITPAGGVVFQAGILDGAGVSIVGNAVIRDLNTGPHEFDHVIDGPVGASCAILITQGDVQIGHADASQHTIVKGEANDRVSIVFHVG